MLLQRLRRFPARLCRTRALSSTKKDSAATKEAKLNTKGADTTSSSSSGKGEDESAASKSADTNSSDTKGKDDKSAASKSSSAKSTDTSSNGGGEKGENEKSASAERKLRAQESRVRKAWAVDDIPAGVYRGGVSEKDIDKACKDDKERVVLKRILGYQNASQPEINSVAIKSALKEFQIHPTDTGSSGAQIAIMTAKIEYLTEHMKRSPKDFSSRRGLEALVEKRRTHLRYLKRSAFPRYRDLITRLGFRDTARTH